MITIKTGKDSINENINEQMKVMVIIKMGKKLYH